jgi:type VI protein secretion system component Hcp
MTRTGPSLVIQACAAIYRVDAGRPKRPHAIDPTPPMKPMRLMLPLVLLSLFAPTTYAPDFGVLLGGSGDTEADAVDSKDWIEIEGIAWTPGTAKVGAATSVAAPAPAGDVKGVTRRTYDPVVLTVPAEGKTAAKLKKAFSKGRKLGTIRLRDGERVLVLHEVVVADVKRTGASETISLNYTKIENAKVPERAKAKIKAEQSGRAPD